MSHQAPSGSGRRVQRTPTVPAPPMAPPTYNPYAAYGALPGQQPPPPPVAGRRLLRREVWWIVALVGVVVLAVVAVLRVAGDRPGPLHDPRDPRYLPVLSDYLLGTGPHGRLIETGQPWGFPCAPVLFRFDPSVPHGTATQFAAVVAAARSQGLNVAAVTGDAVPAPGALVGEQQLWRIVPVVYSTAAAPLNDQGRPSAFVGEYQAQLTTDGRFENFTGNRIVVYGRTTGSDALVQRRMARLAVGRVEGVFGSRSEESGMTHGMRSTVDAFTPADLAAMHLMGGCPAHLGG